MDAASRVSLLPVFILLAFAAFFAVAETAFSSVSDSKIKVASERGDERAKKALFILDNFDKAITTMLIGTNIVHISTATIVTLWVTEKYGLNFVTLSTIITTIVVFFAGEMLPKSIAKKIPEKCALPCAGLVCFFMVLFTPISILLTKLGQFVSRISKTEQELSVTEDELKDIFEDMAEEGSIDENQEDLFSSVLEFTDTRISKILTPMDKVLGIDINAKDEEIFASIQKSNHSRMIAYNGEKDFVVGIIQIRKYLRKYINTGRYPKLTSIIDKPLYISGAMAADDVLDELSKHKKNVAIVQNAAGNNLGIITVEDLLEELVGEIMDEQERKAGKK